MRNEHADIITEDRRLAIQEVTSQLGRYGNLSQLFKDGASLEKKESDYYSGQCKSVALQEGDPIDQWTYSEGTVVAGSAGNEHNAAAAADSRQIGLESSQGNLVSVKVDATTHGVDDRVGLLVDLLLHEVIERSLHDLSQLNLQGLDRADGGDAIVATKAVDAELTLADVGNIIIEEVQDRLGVLDNRRWIRGQEVLDLLREAILAQEGARLAATQLRDLKSVQGL